jgi:hypothetical protein
MIGALDHRPGAPFLLKRARMFGMWLALHLVKGD